LAAVTEDRISKLEDDQGIIRARLEEGVVRQRLSRDIYSNPNSGFRELYANEVRACKRVAALNLQSKHKPRIGIVLDHSNRNLVIHGVNSLGMPLQKFKDVLAVLGETDNDSGSEVGQFGMGHMSFRALSDNILFESYSLESREKYSYLGNGEIYEKLPEPKGLNSTGTRVTVTLRDQVQIDKLEQYVRSVCVYSDVDTFLTVLDEDRNALKEAEQINTCADLSKVPSNFFGIPIEIEDDDFYISGTIASKDTARSDPTILLIRIPIQGKTLERSLEVFSKCVLNVKNERKYRPAADRERLTDEAQTQLLQKIKSMLKQVLASKLDIKTLDDFRNSPCPAFYYRDVEDKAVGEFYQPSNETKEISEIINLHVKRNGDSDAVKLGNLIQQSKNLFFSCSVAKEYEHVLQKEYVDAVVFKFASRFASRNSLLRKYGIRTDVEEEVQRIKTKLGREWRVGLEPEQRTEPDAPYYITTHESWTFNVERYGSTYHYLSQRANSQDRTAWLNMEKVIFIPDDLSKYLDILTGVDCTYKLTKANPKRIPGALALEEFIAKIKAKEVETSEGRKTFSQISDSGESVEVLVYDDARLAKVYKPDEGIFVPLKADEAFELAVFCAYFGRCCKIHQVIREGDFYKVVGKSRSSYFSKSWDGRESYEPDKMHVANCAFHVASGVGDKDLVEMYLCAMEGESDASAYRDFVISAWESGRNAVQRATS
jgi:hypothetical protein